MAQDITAHDEREMLDHDWVNDHTHASLGKVRHRLAYETALPLATADKLRDPDLRVEVDRVSAALPKTVVKPATRLEVEAKP